MNPDDRAAKRRMLAYQAEHDPARLDEEGLRVVAGLERCRKILITALGGEPRAQDVILLFQTLTFTAANQ